MIIIIKWNNRITFESSLDRLDVPPTITTVQSTKLLNVLPMFNVKCIISNDTGVENVHLKCDNRTLVSTFPTEVATL